MERIRFIIYQEFNKYINSQKFWFLNLLVLLILIIAVIIIFPYGRGRNFQLRFIAPLYSHTFLILLVFINMSLNNDSLKFDKVLTIEELNNSGYHFLQAFLVKELTAVLMNIILLLPTIPVILLIYYFGGFSLKSLLMLYAITLIAILFAQNTGMYIKSVFPENTEKVSNVIFVIYLLGLVFTYNRADNQLSVNIYYQLGVFIFSLLLIGDLGIDVMGFIFDRGEK